MQHRRQRLQVLVRHHVIDVVRVALRGDVQRYSRQRRLQLHDRRRLAGRLRFARPQQLQSVADVLHILLPDFFILRARPEVIILLGKSQSVLARNRNRPGRVLIVLLRPKSQERIHVDQLEVGQQFRQLFLAGKALDAVQFRLQCRHPLLVHRSLIHATGVVIPDLSRSCVA